VVLLTIGVLAIGLVLVFAVIDRNRRRREHDEAATWGLVIPPHESRGIGPTRESSDQPVDTREVE